MHGFLACVAHADSLNTANAFTEGVCELCQKDARERRTDEDDGWIGHTETSVTWKESVPLTTKWNDST